MSILPFRNTNESSLADAGHLTSDQLGELLDCMSSSAGDSLPLEASIAEAHLRACAACTAEFNSLLEALSLFREASTAFASRELKRTQPLRRSASSMLPVRAAYSQALTWIAASAILMAGILPLEMRWQRASSALPAAVTDSSASTVKASTHTPESDEALLADIDRELSASVPASMQSLTDPTGEASGESSAQTSSTQRKD